MRRALASGPGRRRLAAAAAATLLALAAAPAPAQPRPAPLRNTQVLVQAGPADCGRAAEEGTVRTTWLGPAHLRVEATVHLTPRIELLDGPGNAALAGRTLVLTHFYRVRPLAADRPEPSCLLSAAVTVDLLGLNRRRHPDLAVRLEARQRIELSDTR